MSRVMSQSKFFEELDSGMLPERFDDLYGEEFAAACFRGVFDNAILPFMVSTRFKFRTVAGVLESSSTVNLANDSKTPFELLELFLFEKFRRNSVLNFDFEDFITQPEFMPYIDNKMMHLYDRVKSGNYTWWQSNIYDQLAALTSDYDRKKLGGVSTPSTVVQNMLSNLKHVDIENINILDPCCGRGIFLHYMRDLVKPSIPINNLYGWEIDARKAYIAQALIDPEECYEPRIWCGNSLNAEITMKFDIIIGNPPYARPSEDHDDSSLWVEFTNVFSQKLKADGRLMFVTPYTWLGKNSQTKKANYSAFTKNQIESCHIFDTKMSQTCFPKIGSTFSFFTLRRTSPDKPTIIVQYVDGKPLQPISEYLPVGCAMPSILTPESLSIHRKITNLPNIGFKRSLECHGQILKRNGIVNDEKTGEFTNKTYYSARLVRYTKKYIKYKDFSSWKIMTVTTSTLSKSWYDRDCNTNEDVQYICVASEVEAVNGVALLNSKLFSYLGKLYRQGRNLSLDSYKLLPYLSFDKLWSDQAIYEALNLSKGEIDFIESLV